MSTQRLPTVFISHGSPMHAIRAGAAGEAWAALGRYVDEHTDERMHKPRAILIASAHWETNIPMTTGAAAPETIHDFGGFPEELYRIQYPAAGDPALAERVQTLLHAEGISAGIETNRGLDHGAWSPLLHMYPDAGVPVVQLSIQSDRGARHHLAVGRAIESLRGEGVLIIGSGHMTHNLRDFFSQRTRGGDARYAQEFRDWVDERVHDRRIEELLDWDTKAPSASRAHPTPEHFLPLFIALGAAGESYDSTLAYSAYEGDILAMDAYRFD